MDVTSLLRNTFANDRSAVLTSPGYAVNYKYEWRAYLFSIRFMIRDVFALYAAPVFDCIENKRRYFANSSNFRDYT